MRVTTIEGFTVQRKFLRLLLYIPIYKTCPLGSGPFRTPGTLFEHINLNFHVPWVLYAKY